MTAAIFATIIATLSASAATSSVSAATRTQPPKDHRWQLITMSGKPAAIAIPCPACRPALILSCIDRGLMRLDLPAATVANGRNGASKLIRITIGSTVENRRSITAKTPAGFTPYVDLPTDDPLLTRLATGRLLELNFYGQRSYVGLASASHAISRARSACRPPGQPSPGHHCTWAVTITCSPDHAAASAAASGVPHAFVRTTPAGYCATLAISDLPHAKSLAQKLGATLERSCLP